MCSVKTVRVVKVGLSLYTVSMTYEQKDCPSCGQSYKSLGKHIASSTCEYPTISSENETMLKGCILGDGTFHYRGEEKAGMHWQHTNKEYLEWIDKRLGYMSNGVKLKQTSQELEDQESGEFAGDNPEYKDIYELLTMRHPGLQGLVPIDDGRPVVKEQMRIRPELLRTWYCADGTLSRGGSQPRSIIYITRSEKVLHMIEYMFERDVGVSPNVYVEHGHLQFTHKDTIELLEYMGEAPPGMEYKWI